MTHRLERIDSRSATVERDRQRHVFRLAATSVLPHAFRIGTFVRWQSGLPYSILAQQRTLDPLPLLTRQLGPPIPRSRQRYPTGERNDQRNAAYWNVDLRLAKELRLGSGLDMQLSVDVFNLLNDGAYQVYDAVYGHAQNVNEINQNARLRFGRRWQLGLRLSY